MAVVNITCHANEDHDIQISLYDLTVSEFGENIPGIAEANYTMAFFCPECEEISVTHSDGISEFGMGQILDLAEFVHRFPKPLAKEIDATTITETEIAETVDLLQKVTSVIPFMDGGPS